MAVSLAADAGFAEDPHAAVIVVAQAEKAAPAPAPAPSANQDDPDGVLKPKTFPETSAEVAECMKSWDPETQMSKEEYQKACQRSLKYFPEKAQ
jgi:hypothetical protein